MLRGLHHQLGRLLSRNLDFDWLVIGLRGDLGFHLQIELAVGVLLSHLLERQLEFELQLPMLGI